jgi:hypothetical protein
MTGPRDWGPAAWLLVALALAVGLAVVAGATTGEGAYGTFNPAWDGGSDLRATVAETGTEPYVLLDRTGYDALDPETTAAVVLSPTEGYGERDRDRLATYVENGGTLVVAEDFRPHANPLLRAVGADARVTGRPLRDDLRNGRTPAFPLATNVTGDGDAGLTRGVDALALNHPSTVDPNGATVLVRSSRFAYVDRNRNGTLDPTERVGRSPVVTSESVGDGRVVVVSDPSLFINAMQGSESNRRFVENVATGHDRVGVDYTHAAGRPPLSVALVSLRRDPLLQVGVGVVALALVGLANRQFDRSGSGGTDERDVSRDGSGGDVTGGATAGRLQTALVRARTASREAGETDE